MNYNKIDKEENERNIKHKDLRGSVKNLHPRSEGEHDFIHS